MLSATPGVTCFCGICSRWGPPEPSCPGTAVSSPTLAPGPTPWMRKAFPYLAPKSRFPGFTIYSLRQPPSRHPSWESMDPPENPAWLSLPCLFCLDNIHSSKSFKVWSHHQSSSISARATHADTQAGCQCDYSSERMSCCVF